MQDKEEGWLGQGEDRAERGSSLPGSSIHGIFHARVLEWGDIAFSHIYAQACLNN